MCSHSVTQCFPCYVSLPCVSICAHTVSHSVSRAMSPCPALPRVSICTHTVSHSVSRAMSPCPALPRISICTHTVSHSVSRAMSPCPALPCPASQYALTLCHTVFPMLRLPALRLNMRSHCVTQCFPCYVSLPCVSMCAQPYSHAMVLSSIYMELTIVTMQCFLLQLKPEHFHANLPITHSCECSPTY